MISINYLHYILKLTSIKSSSQGWSRKSNNSDVIWRQQQKSLNLRCVVIEHCLLAFCISFFDQFLSFFNLCLQHFQLGLSLLWGLLSKQFTGHPLQREGPYRLHREKTPIGCTLPPMFLAQSWNMDVFHPFFWPGNYPYQPIGSEFVMHVVGFLRSSNVYMLNVPLRSFLEGSIHPNSKAHNFNCIKLLKTLTSKPESF